MAIPDKRTTEAEVVSGLRDGMTIANNWTDLIDGAIANPINVSELGALPMVDANPCNGLAGLTRTNTATTGVQFNAALSCNNWSSAAANLITGGGHYFSMTSTWTAYVCAQTCNWKKAIYCFQQ